MYEISWGKVARKNYFSILDFWTEHNNSSTYSVKIVKEVERVQKRISENPYIGALVSTTKEPIRRVLILKTFSLYYKITNKIEVLLFFDNRDDPKKLKEILQ